MKKLQEIKDAGLLSIISGKWFFSIVMCMVLYSMHIELSTVFLLQNEFSLELLGKQFFLISESHGIEKFIFIYKLVSAVSIFSVSFTFYRATFERFLKQKKVAEEIVESIIPDFPYDNAKLQIIVGLQHCKFTTATVKKPKYLIVPEVGMYQNFLITGTIGTGKTASVMYSFLKQIMYYQSSNKDKKAGMLILDVKGNFYKQAMKYAEECGRQEDLLLIRLGGEHTYNPLEKPHMEPVDLAERSRNVIDLFSGGAKKEKFWDTKAAQMMTECIRLMRLTTGYVTLSDIHNLVTNDEFLQEKLQVLYENQDNVSQFDLKACVNYFMGEFSSKAETTIATIKSCVTEMTGFFASSEKINQAFCPEKDKVTFTGFEQCINEGKIVILAMNKAKYPAVARTIAAYLKLDFQSEIQQRTSDEAMLNRERPMLFMCDEYQEFVTANDADFYGLARESKCCNIVSSQSYTSILKTLGNKEAFDTLQQNLINKIWLRTDDKLTVDTAQFLTGKEEKERYSKNISESMNDAKQSKIFGKLVSDKASFSESLNVSTQRDFVFEEKNFTQTLELFKAISFTANENGMNEPFLVHLLPYFMEPISSMSSAKQSLTEPQNENEKKEATCPAIINMKELIERKKQNENE